MKPFHLAISITAACVAFSTASIASNVANYASTQHPLKTAQMKLHAPTNITVINASNKPIYVTVPNSPINDYLAPMINDHIYNYDPYIYWTYLVLRDPYQRILFAANVCRLAIVTVYGYAGSYHINPDSDLCV